MASTCPNCGKRLRIWDVKAECSDCGVSIPNFNWQARLEEDNVYAEQQAAKFNKTMNRIKYSLWGTKLRIARLVLTILPALGFILPWVHIRSEAEQFDLSIISFSHSKALVDFFKSFFGDMGLYFTNMKLEGFSGAVTFQFAGYILFVLSAFFIVLAFLFNIFKCGKPKTKSTITLDVISIFFSVLSVVSFFLSGSAGAQAVAYNFGDFPVVNPAVSIMWGYFIALVLLFGAMGINIAVAVAPAKTDEELESERLAKKAVKEEAEAKKRAEREKAREEAEKAKAEEDAKRVEEAKAKLAASKAKKEKK